MSLLPDSEASCKAVLPFFAAAWVADFGEVNLLQSYLSLPSAAKFGYRCGTSSEVMLLDQCAISSRSNVALTCTWAPVDMRRRTNAM